jgi:hypothetical protein
LRADGSQRLAAGVIRIDERFVEPEPNALALGAAVKGEIGNEWQRGCERESPNQTDIPPRQRPHVGPSPESSLQGCATDNNA